MIMGILKKMSSLKPVLLIAQLLCVLVCLQIVSAAKSGDRVLLNEVKALTLHHGQMTNARRSDPVPQLKCVGGSAGCSFRPKVVQCINKGSDGYDVQWECKTDMDNSYRFGELEVTCEGYDYPEDPFILRGSCGLEYTLELTDEGRERQQHGSQGNQHGGYHHTDDYHDRSNYHQTYAKKTSSVIQDLMFLGIIAAVIYVLYKTCIAPANNVGNAPTGAPPSYEDTFRNQGQGHQPPPYGFRSEYMPNNANTGMGGGCSSSAYGNSQSYTAPGSSTGGGFWSGTFTGGLMGYLLGNRNTGYGYNSGYNRHHTGWWGNRNRGWGSGWGNNWGSGWGSNWGSGFGSNTRTYTSSGSGFSSAPRSSGTRTASGFASTKRR